MMADDTPLMRPPHVDDNDLDNHEGPMGCGSNQFTNRPPSPSTAATTTTSSSSSMQPFDKFSMHTLRLQTHSLKYARYGHGPIRLFFIMGFQCSKEQWWYQMQSFAQMPPSHISILCYDNRGVGESSCPSIFTSTRDMAQDALSILDACQWPTAHIIAASMGGMIAFELACTHTHRVDSLSVANTHAGGRYRTPPLASWLLQAQWGVHVIAGNAQGRIDATLRIRYGQAVFDKAYSELRQSHHERVATVRQPSRLGSIAHTIAVMRHSVSDKRLAELKDKHLPIFLFVGKEDKLISPSSSFAIQKVLKCPLMAYEGVGHGLCGQIADVFNEKVWKHILQVERNGNASPHRSISKQRRQGRRDGSSLGVDAAAQGRPPPYYRQWKCHVKHITYRDCLKHKPPVNGREDLPSGKSLAMGAYAAIALFTYWKMRRHMDRNRSALSRLVLALSWPAYYYYFYLYAR